MQRGLSCEHLSVRPSVRLSVWPSVNAWIVTKRKHLAIKSSIMTNRKSPTSFSMSLRWTAYVAPNPQRGLKYDNFFVFRMKNWLRSKKVCCKVSLCENCQRESCKAFTGISIMHKWLVGDVLFYLKFSTNVTHPILKRWFSSYFLSYHLCRKNYLKMFIITNRKSTRAFSFQRG